MSPAGDMILLKFSPATLTSPLAPTGAKGDIIRHGWIVPSDRISGLVSPGDFSGFGDWTLFPLSFFL